ncbi:hypothetical protein [uncultured Chitinophaga sp.]|uniref:hypothetical protein n=1 Tax=uncultured Chitinophaga sp. TaxID=339340 RepID=UPI0025D8ED58|nr:hypothetical protein [uncultured Chitinophaga sp.]
MVKAVTELRDIIKDITSQSQKQEENSTPGYTRSKDNELEKLQDGTRLLAAQLRASGKLNKDEVRLQSVRCTDSAFELMATQSLLQVSQIIIGHARTKLADFGDFGVTEANILNLESIRAEATRLISQRNVAGGTRKSATDTLPELLTQMRDQLELVDDLIDSLIKDIEFTNVYHNMRKIIDRGGRSIPAEQEQN